MSFLGIDLGTSGVRLLLIDEDGEQLASTQSTYDVSHPHLGWSEQDPADWVSALEAAVSELRDVAQGFSDLKGIAVSGHMHGATLLDKDDKVLRPCILWNDTRAEAEAARLDAKPEMRSVSGNIVFPGFTAPKLEWVREHEPETYSQIARVLLPAAYLNHYLTGAYLSDMSDSAGTSWLDIQTRRWSKGLLDIGNMHVGQMPSLFEGCEIGGHLRDDLRKKWGLNDSVVVAGGAGDNAAAACGMGVIEEGQGFVSLGTSGVLLVARDTCAPAPETALHTFCHAVPGHWYQMGVMLAATDCLNWFSNLTGQSPKSLTDELGDTLAAPGSVRFWPYLSGERTPHNDSQVRAEFSSINVSSTRADLTHAILTGVAFGLRDSLEALRAVGSRPRQLFATGGGSASEYWLKLIATVLDTPLAVPKGSDFGAALGAARLARIAATDLSPQDVLVAPEVERVIYPEQNLVAAYDGAYQDFQSSFDQLKALQKGQLS